MKTATLYAILLCVASVGFMGWRVHALRNSETPHFEIVEDASASHGIGCESLLGLAEQALQSDGMAPGSTLTVLVLGDQSTANEPWRMGTYPLPTIRKVLEGRGEISRRRVEILGELRNKCQLLHRTKISPIFLGVKQALADLRAQGCRPTSHCRVLIDSDLEENVEISIQKALNRTANATQTRLPTVHNDGVDIVFCGLAATSGRVGYPSGREFRTGPIRNQDRDDRLRDIWLSAFSEPQLVKFEPYCPKPSEIALQAAFNSP